MLYYLVIEVTIYKIPHHLSRNSSKYPHSIKYYTDINNDFKTVTFEIFYIKIK